MQNCDFIPDWHDTGACMDRRHILWVYEMLTRLRPTRTLEIGGYTGCSSSAFVAAKVPDAHFAEISPNDKFLSVVMGHGTIHQRKGYEVIRDQERFDVILVDGAHDLVSVSEELAHILAKMPRVIIAHDVNSTAVGFPHCEGAALFNDLHKYGWLTVTDAKVREGERTDRGLLMAFRPNDDEAAKAVVNSHEVTC